MRKQGILWVVKYKITPYSVVWWVSKWHTALVNTTHTSTNTKTLEFQGMSLVTGRPFSRLKQVSGSLVGKKGLKIKASCVWQFRATYLFHFKGSTAFLGCFTELCFQYCVLLKCDFLWPSVYAIFKQPWGENPLIYLMFRQVCLKWEIKSIRWCWKYFPFGISYHINPHMSCSNKSYLFSFKGDASAKSTTEVQYWNFFFFVVQHSVCPLHR